MFTLTCYGGVNEVGGNKFLLEAGESRWFFDFGIPYGTRYRFFEEYLKPRTATGLLDLLEMGLLPPLEGIYRSDLEPPSLAGGLWQRFESHPQYRRMDGVDGVFLSHAHMDHSGYISFLSRDIPIYATAMSGFVAKCMQDTAPTDFEKEVCYLVPKEDQQGALRSGDYRKQPALQRAFCFLDGGLLSEEALRWWNSLPGGRGLEQFPGEGAGRIGGLHLRWFPVDHSIFGAVASALETSRGWVAYTGDLRGHGAWGQLTHQFVATLRDLRPYLLICEGTRAVEDPKRSSPGDTEAVVGENAMEVVRSAQGLVIADFGPRNVERLLTFLRVAKDTSRQLVVLAKDAYLLDNMALVSPDVPLPEKEKDILVYKDRKAQAAKWEQDLQERYRSRLVSASDVRRQGKDFILCFSFWDINELIDINPRGGTYVYSSSEAYNEEQQMDLRRLRHWLTHFDMQMRGDPEAGVGEGLHSSGHASGPELITMVKEISPRIVVPVHTEDPGYFVRHLEGSGIEVHVPESGVARIFE